MQNWIRKNPILSAIVIVTIPSVVAFIIAFLIDDPKSELRKVLYTAAITLIFGGLIGGLLKILLEDFTKRREEREKKAIFINNVLSDLKNVYDRVGRARILIPAHKSALTYGKEMRDLIEARVTLKNVIRALKHPSIDSVEENFEKVIPKIVEMEGYLKELTNEFKDRYKELSNHQRIYEERLKAEFNDKKENDNRTYEIEDIFEEKIEDELNKFKKLQDLISNFDTSDYKQKFEQPLDAASKLLRNELSEILGGDTKEASKEKNAESENKAGTNQSD